jgi:undecaprenyl phosphate-alpha-L-ara4N flippase subunit ArnE
MPSFDSLMPSFGFKLSASTTAYLKLLTCAVLCAAAELLMKIGASAGNADATLGFSALAHAGTWLGIVFFLANFVLWLDVLRTTPVGIAFAVQSVVQLMVPLGAWALLNEQISMGRALGIALVFTGVLLAAAPSALAEERL